MTKKISALGMAVLLTAWAFLTLAVWFSPPKALSESERRPLVQFPALSSTSLIDGSFMEAFEDYSLDQFPGREALRQVKARFHYDVLGQKDNNGIYLTDGYAAKLEYPLNETALAYALERFSWIHNKYLAGSAVFYALIPDKSYFLAPEMGYPSMDYETLFHTVQTELSWAQQIDLTKTLDISDYYRTDLHWRQEALLPTAEALCAALGVPGPGTDFTKTKVNRPFYGVYHGQAALPLKPEELYILESGLLSACRVYDYETGTYGQVYDKSKETGKDLYDVYLSGPRSLLRLENPNAATDRELILFRDSFGSSLAPLLAQGYKSITLVDIRYISSHQLEKYIDFHGQDVLFLYSTLVLNNGTAMK